MDIHKLLRNNEKSLFDKTSLKYMKAVKHQWLRKEIEGWMKSLKC